MRWPYGTSMSDQSQGAPAGALEGSLPVAGVSYSRLQGSFFWHSYGRYVALILGVPRAEANVRPTSLYPTPSAWLAAQARKTPHFNFCGLGSLDHGTFLFSLLFIFFTRWCLILIKFLSLKRGKFVLDFILFSHHFSAHTFISHLLTPPPPSPPSFSWILSVTVFSFYPEIF